MKEKKKLKVGDSRFSAGVVKRISGLLMYAGGLFDLYR